jgi:hypothetical protein
MNNTNNRNSGMKNKMMNKIPSTAYRVPLKTCPSLNNKIRNQTLWTLYRYKNSSKDEISKRIKQLNYEWDTERVLEANAAILILLSTVLGIKHRRCWFALTAIVGTFLLEHALNGWCPPVPIIRKMGIRTTEEIHYEKMVLKILRGDFEGVDGNIEKMFNMALKQ